VHHSGGPRSQSFEEIRNYHMRPKADGGRGFADIAYHHVITEDGETHAGRPLDVIGAHDLGENDESAGVLVTGDNTKPAEAWNWRQKAALIDYVRAMRLLFGPLEVEGHGDREPPETPTACPGCDVRGIV